MWLVVAIPQNEIKNFDLKKKYFDYFYNVLLLLVYIRIPKIRVRI